MKEMKTELTVHNPGVLMNQATDVAGVCKEIVLRTAMTIQGRKYVKVEGWQSIAAAYGCVASSKNVQKVDGGMSATGELHRISDGALIATAEGFVGEDETTWYGGEVMSYGKPKILPKRPDYAIRAMAQTRAISRVCRSAFAFVVVLIDGNLSTTPAEEMVFEHEHAAPQASHDGTSVDRPDGPAESASGGAPLSPSQERLIRVKLKDAGISEFDLARQYPAWSLTPKEGKVTLPKAEVNNVLGWIETQKGVV
jgi:hypothetical protein